MYHHRTVTLVVFLLVCASLGLSARDGGFPRASVPKHECLQGVLIIKLSPDVTNSRSVVQFGVPGLDAVMDQLGLISRRPLMPKAAYPAPRFFSFIDGAKDYGFDRIYVIRYSGPFQPEEAARMVVATGRVDYAEPHWIFKLMYTPNDPLLAQQGWLNIIHAREAWDITKGDSNVVIGVCDTGVEWTHEDLEPNIVNRSGETGLDGQGNDKRSNGIDDDGNGYVDDWHGWDLVGSPTPAQLQAGQFLPDNNPAPRPNSNAGYEGYHGTWVSGCASARADNAKGIAGVGFSTKILPIKATDDSLATGSILAGNQGIIYGVDAGAKIINCSWGGSGFSASQMQAEQDVVNYAYSRGVLVVAASGNAGTNNDVTPSYPANLDHVLSVGATTAADSAAGFSEYGMSVGVWAPGVGIYTTNIGGNKYSSTNVDGTSFSSPIVAGVASLVYAMHPTWTPDQVAYQVRVTGDRVKVRNPVNGPLFYRRVNAYRAVFFNQSFTGANTMPGVGMVSFTINGKTTDTLTENNQPITVQLTLKNYLAPTSSLTITAEAGQALTTTQPSYSVASLGTMQQTTQTIQVKVNPAASILYSEGTVRLILKLTDGVYEDLVGVPIPINIPGWHERYDPSGTTSNYSATSICAPSVDVSWAAANAGVPTANRTTDGGLTWTSYRPIAQTSELVYCIAAVDKDHAWAGSGPTNGQAGVFRTVNGGSTWTRTSVSTITPFVDGIHFFDASNGIFLGDPLSGKWGIGITSDGGATWSPLPSPLTAAGTEAGWNNSFAASGDNLWFGTNNSRIYRSRDRGRTWQFSTTTSINCLGLAFANSNDGMALFRPTQTSGTFDLQVTHDGGATWSSIAMPVGAGQQNSITVVPGTTRMLLGTLSGVYETSDFGGTWKPMAMPVMDFSDIQLAAASDGSGTVAGFGSNTFAQLMAYREVPPAGVSDPDASGAAAGRSVIGSFMGSVPNPFSESATLTFDLIKAAPEASLTFHDATGRVVLLRSLGSLEAGMHSVAIQAGSLPSGTFFCTLSAGEEKVTRSVTVVR